MRKQSIFLSLVLSMLGTPLLAKHSVRVRNNSDQDATVQIVLPPGKSISLQDLDSRQDVQIIKTTTIKALPDTMVPGRDGKERPLSQGVHATIDKQGFFSHARFME